MNRKNEQFYKCSHIAKIITIMVARLRIMNQLLAADEKFKRIVSVMSTMIQYVYDNDDDNDCRWGG